MAGPNAPSIVSIGQASGVVVVGIAQAAVTGSSPVVSYKLYRSVVSGSGYSRVDSESISTVALTTYGYDGSPVFGTTQYYAATAVDSTNAESAFSTAVEWSAFTNAAITGSNIGPTALGPYPLLGSDVFIDPRSGEGIVGPNGDLLTVNGLELLAQDLRIRIFTMQGELLLQPSFGLGKGKIIGSGQGSQTVQAQYLSTLITRCVLSDARVSKVLSCEVKQASFDSWMVSYSLMAIGVEDPFRLNQVVPYLSGGGGT